MERSISPVFRFRGRAPSNKNSVVIIVHVCLDVWKMTRWARANNVHIKKPEDPTPWQKFQTDSNSNKEPTTSSIGEKRRSNTQQNAAKRFKNTSKTYSSESKTTLLESGEPSEAGFSRKRTKTCFQCKSTGHLAANCPSVTSSPSNSVVCYKCGSTEHMISNCKKNTTDLAFATCYICGAEGHISRNCPQNTNGIYRDGGGCRSCGSNQHLQKDCPKLKTSKKQTEDDNVFLEVQNSHASADEILVKKAAPKNLKTTNRVVKF